MAITIENVLANLSPGMNMDNPTIVGFKQDRGGENPIVAYTNEFNGKAYFHVRELWFSSDENWKMGKGLSMPIEKASAFCAAVGKLATPQSAKALPAPVRKAKVA